MKRTLKEYVIISLKGMSMGAADVVPGVSGGTIAFISGIYEELLNSISSFNLGLIKTLRKEGIKSVWEKVNGSFLIALFVGVFVSFISLSKVIENLLRNQPVLIWSFFMGWCLPVLFISENRLLNGPSQVLHYCWYVVQLHFI